MSDIPGWEAFILPTLSVMNDGVTRTRRDIHPLVAEKVGLTDGQRTRALASGQVVYANRIGWGLSLLTKVGALARPVKGSYAMTDAGRWLLARSPEGLSNRQVQDLGEDEQSPLRPYVASVSKRTTPDESDSLTSALTPTELIQEGMKRIHEEVAGELLDRLLEREPEFFEEAVVKLLLAMGYGGTNGRGTVTSLRNDGGIDGVIDQDILGLSRVYVQAKRYSATNGVQRPDIQAFVGALSGKADAGVFITTSRFSEGAVAYTHTIPTRVVLIDGERLANLMIQYGVGVQTTDSHHVVEVDEDLFA
jgi:restriction system protein